MSPTSFTLSVEDNGAVISTLIWWCFVNDRYNQGNLSELVRRALFDDVGLATEFLFCLIKTDFKLSEVSIFFFFLSILHVIWLRAFVLPHGTRMAGNQAVCCEC